MKEGICPLVFGHLLADDLNRQQRDKQTPMKAADLHELGRCRGSCCQLWVNTFTTEGIMVGTCGLVRSDYVRNV